MSIKFKILLHVELSIVAYTLKGILEKNDLEETWIPTTYEFKEKVRHCIPRCKCGKYRWAWRANSVQAILKNLNMHGEREKKDCEHRTIPSEKIYCIYNGTFTMS